MPPRTVLITGATGKQDSAVIDALLSHPLSSSDPFTVLARKSATRTMGWTILGPVIFMDNPPPGLAGKVFMTLLRDTLGRDKPLQWIATRDIGFFAAEAFHNPEEWNKKARGLAGDELTFEEMNRVFERVTGKPVPTTWGLLGKGLKTELGSLVEWLALEVYRADLRKVKEVNPGMVGLEEWLRKSPFVKRK
ncbi:hypothetical protein QC762_123560 [Podospora pseudocomata]|uniref:NmrA-like domain-containing protein n=1 Tax=Podospora pseudocomata TaxID=2093779 RepID=A0ABR0GYY5_9PEZI|nr:hypothetical protein QC762_123560 [Podospora pseudocomata]